MGAKYPMLVFGTGEVSIVKNYTIVHEGSRELYELRMAPTPETLDLHKEILREKLDYSDIEFIHGLLTRRYLATDILFFSNSPTNPVWIALCCFDSSPLDVKGTKLEWLMRLKDQLEAAKQEVARARGENEEIKEELNMSISQIEKWYRRKGQLFDPTEKLSDIVAKILAMQKRTS